MREPASVSSYKPCNLHFSPCFQAKTSQTFRTDLWPAASDPVCWAGSVCVACGYGLGFGKMFTVAGIQSFLLVCTHSLDAENHPFSQAQASTACGAFMPIPNLPSAQRDTKDANTFHLFKPLSWMWHCNTACWASAALPIWLSCQKVVWVRFVLFPAESVQNVSWVGEIKEQLICRDMSCFASVKGCSSHMQNTRSLTRTND